MKENQTSNCDNENNNEEPAPSGPGTTAVVSQLIQHGHQRLLHEEMTVTDLTRLAELRKELSGKELREILVRWVDGSATDTADKK